MKQMMRTLIAALAMLFVPAALATNIVFVDIEKAILSTKEAKAFLAEAKGSLEAEQAQVVALEKQAREAKAKLDENLGLVSTEQAEQLKRQFQQVYGAYQQRVNRLQQMNRELEQTLANKMMPKARDVMRKIAETEKYDMIISSQVVAFARETVNITPLVTQLLDQQ
ncbi:MAG: OmpH family outer membrane protein [Pontibacterium sp.]